MKRFIILIILVTILSSVINAQNDSSGIYFSAQDFVNHKLSYAINCNSEKHRIRLNDFFNKPFITVKHLDSSYRLYKNKVFGFRTCGGNTIRFDKQKELILLNPGEAILIYRHDVAKPPKGLTNVTNYYFSIGAYAPVQSLTFKNLKKALPDNQKFYQEIDSMFKYNTELTAYDNHSKMFMLNWIYKHSLE